MPPSVKSRRLTGATTTSRRSQSRSKADPTKEKVSSVTRQLASVSTKRTVTSHKRAHATASSKRKPQVPTKSSKKKASHVRARELLRTPQLHVKEPKQHDQTKPRGVASIEASDVAENETHWHWHNPYANNNDNHNSIHNNDDDNERVVRFHADPNAPDTSLIIPSAHGFALGDYVLIMDEGDDVLAVITKLQSDGSALLHNLRSDEIVQVESIIDDVVPVMIDGNFGHCDRYKIEDSKLTTKGGGQSVYWDGTDVRANNSTCLESDNPRDRSLPNHIKVNVNSLAHTLDVPTLRHLLELQKLPIRSPTTRRLFTAQQMLKTIIGRNIRPRVAKILEVFGPLRQMSCAVEAKKCKSSISFRQSKCDHKTATCERLHDQLHSDWLPLLERVETYLAAVDRQDMESDSLPEVFDSLRKLERDMAHVREGMSDTWKRFRQ